MDSMKSKNIFLDTNVLYETIDGATSNKDVANMNILFEDVAQKLKIYDDNEWRTVLFENGVKEIIQGIKDNYLDMYERYLVRLYLHPTSYVQKRETIKEYMEEYYKFIVCYGLPPFVAYKTDYEIIHPDGDSDTDGGTAPGTVPGTVPDTYDIQDVWFQLYKRVKESLSTSYKNKIRKEVADIVKRNAKANTNELNKEVMSLIQMDEEFKRTILQCVL
jgi:hypothetical protein